MKIVGFVTAKALLMSRLGVKFERSRMSLMPSARISPGSNPITEIVVSGTTTSIFCAVTRNSSTPCAEVTSSSADGSPSPPSSAGSASADEGCAAGAPAWAASDPAALVAVAEPGSDPAAGGSSRAAPPSCAEAATASSSAAARSATTAPCRSATDPPYAPAHMPARRWRILTSGGGKIARFRARPGRSAGGGSAGEGERSVGADPRPEERSDQRDEAAARARPGPAQEACDERHAHRADEAHQVAAGVEDAGGGRRVATADADRRRPVARLGELIQAERGREEYH